MRNVITEAKVKIRTILPTLLLAILLLSSCASQASNSSAPSETSSSPVETSETSLEQDSTSEQETVSSEAAKSEQETVSSEAPNNEQENVSSEVPSNEQETVSPEAPNNAELVLYTDQNGDSAYIPADFNVSEKADEQTIRTGLVVIGPDGSEFVWIPTTDTPLAVREFGSYFSGGTIDAYYDETEYESYQKMLASVEKYGGFYIGRYEASKGEDGLPASKRITESEPGTIWVRFSPQETVGVCDALYADNDTVQGFFPWGINWDTTLQWLVDSGDKQISEINADSTSWGNYSNDSFSDGARGNYTGAWEEAKANNIYDLAGNNWEWTRERCGSNYVMRGGGYSLMGGACPGNMYPAALRDPLPGNDHHPNVTFRVALYLE